MRKNKNIYQEPFIDHWPLPITFNDIKECFKTEIKSKKRSESESKFWKIVNQYTSL